MSSPLDLNGIGLACLCGDNGHGKSALLDATTWVLWGESRAERQEDLIYQGAREMSVELVFLAHDQQYKAIHNSELNKTINSIIIDAHIILLSKFN